MLSLAQQRREEHERHIREQEEELLQQELELQERQQRQAKEEQQRKADAEQKRSSTLFQPEEFDYTFHHGGQPNFIFPMQVCRFDMYTYNLYTMYHVPIDPFPL